MPTGDPPGHRPEQGDAALHEYVAALFDADPILASEQGEARGLDRLGEITPDAFAGRAQAQRELLAQQESRPELAAVGSRPWLERQVLLVELWTALAEEERGPAWQRAPYWYAERLGAALAAPMAVVEPVAGGEALLGRLGELPGYCGQAAANLTAATPPLWAQMGISAARGLERFVASAVTGYAAGLPGRLADELARAVDRALPSIHGFVDSLERLAGSARGEWACGREHFDLLLRRHHLIELDADGLAEFGRELVHKERATLVELAQRLDPDSSWQQQIDRIKDEHPPPERFLDTYADAMLRSRAHAIEHDLITVPDGAECVLDWVPEYRREGLPLGVMDPSPPFQPGLNSRFLLTPVDPSAPAERQRQHARDNCYAFATSIAGHETYPGTSPAVRASQARHPA